MREIKFRGFQKTWIYGGISVFENEATIFDVNCVVNSAYEVDIKSIGQFTGLKDKNGVEIYEGDIVKKTIELKDGLIANWIVVYGEAGFDIKKINPKLGEVETMYLKKYWKHSYEIIGNVFENPEMLLVFQAIT